MTETIRPRGKRLLGWGVALLSIVFVGDRVLAYALGRLAAQSQFRYTRLYRPAGDGRMLLLGNSRGLSLFQPSLEAATGLSTVNLSYNGLPLALADVLMRDYLDRHPVPDLLLMDITMLDRQMDERLVQQFLFLTNHSDRLRQLVREQNPTVYFFSRLFHLYRYNSEVYYRTLYYRHRTDADWLLDRVITGDQLAAVRDAPPYTFEYDREQLDMLAGMVAYAAGKGVEVRLLVNPYLPDYVSRLENLDAMVREVSAACGIPVYDFSSAVTDTTGFGDYQHLNKRGAARYVRLLQEKGLLDISSATSVVPPFF
jgi:hypothetical protein